jgi:hypothetical protein
MNRAVIVAVLLGFAAPAQAMWHPEASAPAAVPEGSARVNLAIDDWTAGQAREAAFFRAAPAAEGSGALQCSFERSPFEKVVLAQSCR